MIVRARPTMPQLLYILTGSIILRILPQVVAVFLLSTLVVWGHTVIPGLIPGAIGAPFALIGVSLSIFLGFRNSACYDRWWEARKCWGELVYAARTFARQTLVIEARFGEEGAEIRHSLISQTIAIPHAMVNFLRPGGSDAAILHHLPAKRHAGYLAASNGPDFILRGLSLDLATARAANRLTDIEFQTLDATVQQIAMAHAKCERIHSTPIPYGYTLLVHRTAHLFCLLLPFGFADLLGWGTTFITTLVAYTFFGLDALGDELEEPFGNSANDLPIDALAQVIEINLREALGQSDLPPMPKPMNYILM